MSRKIAGFILLACCMLVTATGYAEDNKQSKADAAVANILFDYDFGSEFATYRVNEDGFVDIIMAKNTPAKVYSEILNRLQNHPDIDGVMPSKSGPACSVSNW